MASLLKASLTIQYGEITPNMHFSRLNPEIEPFYENLMIPTSSRAWPTASSIRRASVNSFGFGGTNAHAILENYVPTTEQETQCIQSTANALPFVFSAQSEKSLVEYLENFANYLDTTPCLKLRDLSDTLLSRRTRFALTTYFSATSKEILSEKIRLKLQDARADPKTSIGWRQSTSPTYPEKPLSVLLVFTGQGAQWPRQAYELVESSATIRKTLETLEKRLSELPEPDRPSWSLTEELGKDTTDSRIGESELSQPLCTAIQIFQVDLLRAAGVKFTAAVGHSSGEIGAAYAIGIVTAEEAICIAYYRGLYSTLAQGKCGEEGTMMAVEGTKRRNRSCMRVRQV